MRKHLEISEDKQTDFWPVLKIDEKSIGLDFLLKLKKEIKIERQKKN